MIYGILLAAGMGRRMGRPKALMEFRVGTLHSRGVGLIRSAGLEVMVVVNPVVSDALRKAGPEEQRVLNPDPEAGGGMFRSVQLGVGHALALGASGVVVIPVDLPLVTPDDVRAVVAALRAGSPIAVATHLSRRGHPVGMNLAVMREVADAAPGSTLRDLVRRDPGRVSLVEVSEGAILGVNTREELERLLARSFR